jgi:phosphoribosylformylglycinamidine cyclo-ligase
VPHYRSFLGGCVSSYQEAGVSISNGNEFVERIKPLAQRTTRPGVIGSLCGFGAVFDPKQTGMRDPLFVSTTDGVGTKLELAKQVPGSLYTLGQDLVAMCVNDLVCMGATPLWFLDYLSVGQLDVELYTTLLQGVAEACSAVDCALVGGETAEMPGVYQPKDFDVAGFSVGAVERDTLLPQNVAAGDSIVGIASSGIHSNGFSLVRKLIQDHQLDLMQSSPWDSDKTLGESLMTPTRLYVKPILALHQLRLCRAAAHITGGGLLGNLPRVLPAGFTARITNLMPPPPVFTYLQKLGTIAPDEMRQVFNMGVGMCVVTNDPHNTISILSQMGEDAQVIGEITTGTEPIIFE